jgi:hypothetical protein
MQTRRTLTSPCTRRRSACNIQGKSGHHRSDRNDRHESGHRETRAQGTGQQRWKKGEEYQPIGSITLALTNPVKVGLAVCSHNAAVSETAIFSNVEVKAAAKNK